MDNFKYYIGEILEINCGFEYETKYIFKIYKDEPTDGCYEILKKAYEHTDRVAMNWRGGNKHDWDVNEGGYRSGNTFIFDSKCREISKEEFNVLSKHLAIV